MKYFVIFLALAVVVMLAPQAFGNCTSLPCDDANIKLGEPNYRFIDFSHSNKIGEPIQFILEKTRDNKCSSYNAKITDDDGNFILGWGAEILCDPTSISNSEPVLTKIGYNENNPIIINDSGKYFLEVKFNDVFIKREFVVRQNYVGANIDNTDYSHSREFLSPLKQIKSGIATDKIRCNEGLKLVYKHNQMPSCVKSESIPKLAERGWINETDEHSLLTLKKVENSCANDSPKERMANPLRHSNGTHAFSNLGCEWKKIGKFVGDLESFTSSYMNEIIPTLEDFKNFTSESPDIDTIFFRFGEPSKDIGSGIHIYVYELNDSTEIWIGYSDHILYVRHVDSGGNFLESLFVENEN